MFICLVSVYLANQYLYKNKRCKQELTSILHHLQNWKLQYYINQEYQKKKQNSTEHITLCTLCIAGSIGSVNVCERSLRTQLPISEHTNIGLYECYYDLTHGNHMATTTTTTT